MIIKAIASSSKGNSYIISDGFSNLLVEVGVLLDRVRPHINLTTITGVLITHEHQDHCKYASDIIKYAPIYASNGTLEAIKSKLGKYYYNTIAVAPGETYSIGSFKVTPFNTEHDASEPLGFYIYSGKLKESLLFATDTYYIRNRFKGLNYIMIECNYSIDILEYNINNDLISKTVSSRLRRSHMELGNLKKFLKANDLSQVKEIYLLHLSSSNGDEKMFKSEIEKTTGVPVIVCKE